MSKAMKRNSDRADLDLLYVNKIVGDEPHLTRARDISADGIFLYKLLEPEIDPAGRVGLELMLPGGEEVIWALGEVVRQDTDKVANGVGVKFIQMAPADRDRIRRWVAQSLSANGASDAAIGSHRLETAVA